MVHPLLHPEGLASLNAEQSAELSARLAMLAKSGLPLEGGLRALADEIERPSLRHTLKRLAAYLEAGENLETAIAAQEWWLPPALRGLIVAGVRSGRLPQIFDQYSSIARRQNDLRRRLFLSLAYPVLLLGMIAALVCLFHLYVAPEYFQVFRDFGTKLPWLTTFYFNAGGVISWITATVAVAAALLPLAVSDLLVARWCSRFTSRIPFFGPIIRYGRLAEFSQLMAMFLEEEFPLPESLRFVASATLGTPLAEKALHMAAWAQDGMPIADALRHASLPETLTALVRWGQEKNCLAESFRAAGDAFEARTRTQSSLFNMIALPIMYWFIVTFIGITMLALLMPLISLISNLSG